jgi:hypothetical protein
MSKGASVGDTGALRQRVHHGRMRGAPPRMPSARIQGPESSAFNAANLRAASQASCKQSLATAGSRRAATSRARAASAPRQVQKCLRMVILPMGVATLHHCYAQRCTLLLPCHAHLCLPATAI